MSEICNRCKQPHEHVCWEHKKRARFYNAMVGDFSQCMCIPEKFFSQIGESLLEVVDLRSPSGSVWHVGLTRRAGEVFLQYGWREFVEAHRLEENDVLLFEYEGDSCFNVLVFDSSRCEREASYFYRNEHSRNRKETEECSLKFLEPSPVQAYEGYDCGSDSGHRGESSCSRRKIQKGHKKSAKRHATEIKMKDPMELACSLRTSGPSFVAKVKPYNVNYQFQLLVPSDFAEFLPRTSQEIFLRIPNEQKEWKVNYTIGEKAKRIIGGWRYFARDNNLKEGDACLYVLSKSKKKVAITVHIFRVGNQTSSSPPA